MKKILALFVFAGLFFTACRKADNPKIPVMELVPLPSILIDPSSDKFISPVDPASFQGKVTIDLFYKNDTKPQKFDVVIVKNSDNSKVVTLQANVTTFPISVDVTGAQLATLFGEPVSQGDRFDVGVDITSQSGKKYPAFPAVGAPYGAGIAGSGGGVPLTVRFAMLCRFDANFYSGDFTVLADQWQDYPVGAIITLTRVGDNTVSFEYAADNPQPILVHVNPNTNETSVALQEYGSYGGEVYSAQSAPVPKADDNVSPCEGTLTINLKHSAPSGSSDYLQIKLKKVP